MKLQKDNVIYRVEKEEEIQYLKSKGFKEVKAKAKADLTPKKDGKDEGNKEGK